MPHRPDATWTITLDGAAIPAVPGESLAAALLMAGHAAQGVAKDGTPRGVFCGMGVCHDCLVVVDGHAGLRACMTRVRDGMRVERQPARLDLADPSLAALGEPPRHIPETSIDILVIGAGPAGLAAAESAAVTGASVLVIDERPAPGGQYYKQPGTAGAERARDAQAAEGAALIARVRALGVTIASGSVAWGAERDSEGLLRVGCLTGAKARTLRPRLLVVATGATEQAPILPGWTLPGVMTTGALQTLVRSDGAAPGRRILIAGNGPLNLQVAAELLRCGATLAGVVEAAPAPWTRPRDAVALAQAAPALAAAGLRHIAALMRAGVPIVWGSRLRRIQGNSAAAHAHVESISRDAPSQIFEADLVAIGEGFAPANELPRLLGCRHETGPGGLVVTRDATGATSLPDVFVAGEAGRFGGARIARVQGSLAGRAAARPRGGGE